MEQETDKTMPIINNPETTNCQCFALTGRNIVLKADGTPITFADLTEIKALDDKADLFEEQEFGICALSFETAEPLPDRFITKTIRQYFNESDEPTVFRVSRAKAVANWRQSTRFCCTCGTKLTESKQFTARECPQCGKIHFPRIEPCVIVLVSRGDKILLARHVQRNQDIYACIAGFIEGGETPEHAVERELQEEIGIKVKNVCYRGSQSWPFPDQLMLGYTAEYESGEIKLQKDEIADAGWFSRDNCPASPQPGSIAYRLIHGLI